MKYQDNPPNAASLLSSLRDIGYNIETAIEDLIDNSITAESTLIEIRMIWNEGEPWDAILDNGKGMSKSDLKIAFNRFTTSKISLLEDLEEINTLGFRGEALASIASISNIIVISKATKSTNGYEMSLSANNVSDLKPSSIESGTIIDIKNMFHNVPARK